VTVTAEQLPATLVDHPVVAVADQGKVVNISAATVDPMLQVVRRRP
jgi:hypothetical protein